MLVAGAVIGVFGLLVILHGGATVWKAARPERMEEPRNAAELRRLGERIARVGLALAVIGAVLLVLGAITK